MNDSPVIQTRELTKQYGDFVALSSLSLSLNRGSILGFIGPNGAGKTTTVNILVGLLRPTGGSAQICGIDCVAGASKIKHLVGYMPDVFGSYDNMRVREYLDFFATSFNIPRRDRLHRIAECLEITSSTYMQDRFVEALSHGMKQRVALTRILLHNPQVLILDEPANGLDPQARIEMRQILLQLADMGKTLIVTSHILPELARICDTVAIMTQGRLRAFGPIDQIMSSLRQQRIFEVVLLDKDQVQQTINVLRPLIEPNASITPSPAEGEVRFTTAAADPLIAQIAVALHTHGVHFTQFREVALDLEDAFLNVTRESQGGSGDRPAQSSPPASPQSPASSDRLADIR